MFEPSTPDFMYQSYAAEQNDISGQILINFSMFANLYNLHLDLQNI